jgi:hypothetical protein
MVLPLPGLVSKNHYSKYMTFNRASEAGCILRTSAKNADSARDVIKIVLQ